MLYVKKHILSVIFLVLGICAGFILDKDNSPLPQSVREESSSYKFINPLLFVDYGTIQEDDEYVPLKKNITNYIDKAIAEEKVSEASVYFRKLNLGKSISVYSEKTYSPSSMLKVVNMVAALRIAELDPSFLSKRIFISKSYSSYLQDGDRYEPKLPVKIGGTYTIKELVEHTIIESDNVANKALKDAVGEEILNKTYEDLNMPKVDLAADRGYNPEYYSHLFRALYNGTYLSKPVSEKVLELLSNTLFNKGIVAGVPTGTTVSHKFGINAFTVGPYAELHDCGIVYYPEHPYFVCIMTRGNDLATLETIIKDISTISWEFVNSIHKLVP
ncbi:class A beta-lactamase-related serine hydrolase [Candidatus Nomurabacteria bacterium]|nr:class A beta-lactamase-related serine hydrolase [Candidatus Nomurabacteria bacterium]